MRRLKWANSEFGLRFLGLLLRPLRFSLLLFLFLIFALNEKVERVELVIQRVAKRIGFFQVLSRAVYFRVQLEEWGFISHFKRVVNLKFRRGRGVIKLCWCIFF